MKYIRFQENIKVRKQHKCFACGFDIEVGENCDLFIGKGYGQIHNIYTCGQCKSWCEGHECRKCFDDDNAIEGYVSECRNEDIRHRMLYPSFDD